MPFPIIAVIPGAETGVELADRLSSRLGLRSNGEAGSLARRNKYLMGETVRNAGVRAVKQKRCYSIKDMDIFVKEELGGSGPFKCVVKPVQSAGSDDVYLCNDADEAKIAFQWASIDSTPAELRSLFAILTSQGFPTVTIYNDLEMRLKLMEDYLLDFNNNMR